jgi:hypothetical protein
LVRLQESEVQLEVKMLASDVAGSACSFRVSYAL